MLPGTARNPALRQSAAAQPCHFDGTLSHQFDQVVSARHIRAGFTPMTAELSDTKPSGADLMTAVCAELAIVASSKPLAMAE